MRMIHACSRQDRAPEQPRKQAVSYTNPEAFNFVVFELCQMHVFECSGSLIS